MTPRRPQSDRPARRLARALVCTLAALAVGLPAQAEMIPTAGAAPATAASAGAATRPRLAREAVRAELVAIGLPADEAALRAGALTDADLAQLGSLGDEPAGRGFVGVAVFVFAVLLMTDVLGYTRIFPFTRPWQR